MNISPEEYNLLKKIEDFENNMSEYEKGIGWRWLDIGAYPATINRLVIKGLVKISYKSHSSTNYLLTDEARAVLATAQPVIEPVVTGPEVIANVSTMFSDIIGYDNIKELLREALQLDKPLHVLLYGPPSLAKTLFLWDIERAAGEAAMWLIGSATSRAGLWDVVAEKRPKWLLVDEIDKMTIVDMAALLSLMEKGRLVRAKVGRKLDEKLNIWVIAAANKIGKLPAELLSRFSVQPLTEYTATEFRDVVTNVLTIHEDTDHDTAAEIAMRLVGKTHDVRDAVRVARLAKRVGVKRAVELLIK